MTFSKTFNEKQAGMSHIAANGYVSADDVLSLRREIFADGIISKEELGMLLALAERAPEGDREWTDFFGEAAGDYYLREEIPHDYITEREFRDIKLSVTQYGETVTPLVLSMLVKLVHDATATPPMMSEFIIDQIKAMISNRDGEPVITADDTALIRKFLYASGGDGNMAITQKEAVLLFDLNDMTMCTDNDPAWSELFVKANANHLMAHIGYQPPSREEALRQWEWMSDQSVDVSGFFKRMVSGGLSSLRNTYAERVGVDMQASESVYEQIHHKREQAIADAEEVTTSEADWLADRIGRDGVMDDNERALLAYMHELEAELPPKLKALLQDVA